MTQWPDAASSDPATLQWMVGSPPPVDKLIQFADGSAFRFPERDGRTNRCTTCARRRRVSIRSRLAETAPSNWRSSVRQLTRGVNYLRRGPRSNELFFVYDEMTLKPTIDAFLAAWRTRVTR